MHCIFAITYRFGRRKALIVMAWLNVPASIAASFAPTYWIFVAFRVAAMIGVAGLATSIYCYGNTLLFAIHYYYYYITYLHPILFLLNYSRRLGPAEHT